LEAKAAILSQLLCISQIVSEARLSGFASRVVCGNTRELLSLLLSTGASATAHIRRK
jgi:hypothetical protein